MSIRPSTRHFAEFIPSASGKPQTVQLIVVVAVAPSVRSRVISIAPAVQARAVAIAPSAKAAVVGDWA